MVNLKEFLKPKMTRDVFSWRVLDVANGTERSNALFLWLQLGQSTFLLKKFFVC